MSLTREQIGQIYRPVGQKLITSFQWASGNKGTLANGIDLSIPLRGLRFVFKGRCNIATAAYTNVNPESLFNLIPRVYITGINSRQGGNVTLCDMSFANLFLLASEFGYEASVVLIKQGAGALTDYGSPTTPLANVIPVTAQANDFVIIVDVPFHLHAAPAAYRAAFAARQEEFKGTLQLLLQYGITTDNAENSIGLSAATTVTTMSAFGGGGSATIDVYGLPLVMGLDLKDAVLPGVLSRTEQPIVLTANNAAGAVLPNANLQQLATTRIFFKQGTSTLNPYFKTLSDAIVTTLGLKIGGNRVVREDDDWYAVKMERVNYYMDSPTQGIALLDFVQSGSPFSAYPGDDIGQGTLFQLTGAVTGTANGYGVFVQEEMLHKPSGSLYA